MKTLLLLVAGLLASHQLLAAGALRPLELSDAELAQLRGRFVLPDRIVSFGVTMNSTWQTASGQVLQGSVNLQLQNQPGTHAVAVATPVFNVTLTNVGGASATPGTGQVSGGAGLSQVQGIAQSVRAAGDYNAAGNDMSVSVQKGGSLPTLSNPSSDSAALNQTLSSNAGSVSLSTTASGGLALSIQALGQGSASQSIGSGGAAQAIALTGNANLVQNSASLNVILKDNPSLGSQINGALQQLNSLRPGSY